ncbi:MAG: hypothetical protein AAF078_06965, partial [Planctomycetota bacterium]
MIDSPDTLAPVAAVASDPTTAALILRSLVTAAYVVLLALICTYGVHRYWLMRVYQRHLRSCPRPATRFIDLPRVTVQLPMFNEGTVGERIIDAAAALDYPADRLQIQVVDDSTDSSAALAERRVA